MSDSQPTTTHHCCVCGKPSSLRCSRCLGAQYCDVSCQRKDWKSHKESCKSAEGFKKSIEQAYSLQATAEDVDSHIVALRCMAELGSRHSMVNLGIAYRTGMGVVKDDVEATKLYKRSADLGDVNVFQMMLSRRVKSWKFERMNHRR
jgi:TPR repeat protein